MKELNQLSVQANLNEINARINEACENANRSSEEITIIGVTKYVSVERAREAVTAGVRELGENRMKGLLEKQESLSSEEITWHFIGSLQTKKVKHIIDQVDYIHSLDRMSLAKEINKRASQPIHCFIQVNVAEEDSKHGLALSEVIDFVKNLENYPNIRIVGLMTMAPFTQDETILRQTFRQLRQLRDQIQALTLSYAPCTELSMGMSNDYVIAIEEGATYIRLGSKLVGESI